MDNYIESVKQVVSVLLVLHEELKVLEDALLHLDAVVVSYRVFAEEVKLYHELLAVILLMQLDVFDAE